MKILVYGAGVIGSVYAARLQEAGYNVTLFARGQRADTLRTQGLILEDASTGKRTTTPIAIIDHLAPTESYDLVIVTVRLDQVASVLPTLAANQHIPSAESRNLFGNDQMRLIGSSIISTHALG